MGTAVIAAWAEKGRNKIESNHQFQLGVNGLLNVYPNGAPGGHTGLLAVNIEKFGGDYST